MGSKGQVSSKGASQKRTNLQKLTSEYFRGTISFDQYVSSTGSGEYRLDLRSVVRNRRRLSRSVGGFQSLE